MKKMAIFVEGQTEQIFVSKLLIEIAGEKNIYIEKQQAKADRNGRRFFTVIGASSRITEQKYYVLIRDCGSESNVKTDIRDSCESLANSDYEKIIGVRDVFPQFSFADITKLEYGLKYGMPTRYLPIHIMLAVMEIEAWFLSETSHFNKIHTSITIDLIKRSLGFDPTNEDMERRSHPSQDLNDIYHLAGLAYTKKKSHVQRTVNALDYNALYLAVRHRVNNLNKFIEQIDSFLV